MAEPEEEEAIGALGVVASLDVEARGAMLDETLDEQVLVGSVQWDDIALKDFESVGFDN